MLKLPVYLDNNATTPMDPRVLEAMIPYFTGFFGNAASRNHLFGWQAEAAVGLAREQVATLIGAHPNEIIFTSGATESDNLAIKGVLETYAVKGDHVITCVTEHKAVLDSCKHLEKLGATVTYLTVNKEGLIDLQQLEASIKPTTVLIALMYANNETGVIQPVKEIGSLAHRHGILFFTDATQAVGKIPVDVIKDRIDLMSFSAHKMYGPKGTGGLYVRRKDPRVKLTAQIDGGGHEKGMRSGTLNVPGIVGLGKACEICSLEMEADARRIEKLRDKLELGLLKIEATFINGSKLQRLPNVSNLSFNYTDGRGLLTAINKNIAVSSGSACISALPQPSYVLKAMGLNDEQAHSSLRFGLGRFTTTDEIDYTLEEVINTVWKLREMNPLWEMYKAGMDLEKLDSISH